jgi:hypothetical protein
MKTLISLVVLISSIQFAQNQLQNPLSNNLLFSNSKVSNNSTSRIKHQASSIQLQESRIKFQENELPKKSSGLAILYSLLLPGMGELYAESYNSGKYFTIADGILWGVFSGFDIYANWKENNYKSFAESKAEVKLMGKDAEYFANIGIYQSIDDYNTAMELNRNFSKTYNTSTHYWKWIDNDQRKEYRDMWSSSEQAYTNVRFVVGALVLNRLISAINAVRLVSAYNKNLSQELSWNFSINLTSDFSSGDGIRLNFYKQF